MGKRAYSHSSFKDVTELQSSEGPGCHLMGINFEPEKTARDAAALLEV